LVEKSPLGGGRNWLCAGGLETARQSGDRQCDRQFNEETA
jgi:hypothetical protein